MKQASVIAAAFLALGFGVVSFILLVIEPRMDITRPADYFDPAKVLVAAASPAWLAGDLIYLGFGVALAYLALSSEDLYLRASGLAAGVLFVLVASMGRVLVQLPALTGSADELQAALLGLLAVRFAALKSTVLALGIFAWRTTRDHPPKEGGSALWKGFGYLVLAASAAFVFVFIPAPLLFTIWATWYAFRRARAA